MNISKSKKLLFSVMLLIIVCFFSLIAYADSIYRNETFTLSDGTELPLWDESGEGLIWYKSTANQNDGYAAYDCVTNNQTDSASMPYITYNKGKYTRSVDGKSYQGYQLSSFTVTDANGTYSSLGASSAIVVANLKGAIYSDNNVFNMFASTFKESGSIEAVYFDERTLFILDWTLYKCANLRKINIQETILVEIGSQAAFAECPKLTEIVLPNTVVSVGSWPFQNTGITQFTIPSSVKYWGDSSFKSCKSLKYVYGYEDLILRGAITSIKNSTFQDCTSLVYVFSGNVCPEGITSIGNNAFLNCSSLGPELKLPNSLTTIGQNAFRGCSSLEVVRLGAGLTTLTSYDAFNTCNKLTEIYIPGTVSNVPINTFKNSNNIKRVFFVGTLDVANAFIASANKTGGNTTVTGLPLISYNDYKALEDKSGKHFVYDFSECVAFRNGYHRMTDTPYDLFYYDGFDKNGTGYFMCTTCGETEIKDCDPIIESLGYSFIDTGSRIKISSGFTVNHDLAVDYQLNNHVSLEIGIMFADAAKLTEAITSLEGFTYFSDKGDTHSTYNYIVSFPGVNSGKYSEFALREFVVSAFIYDGANYSFYQGDDSTVNTLPSGFKTSTLAHITKDKIIEISYNANGGYFAEGTNAYLEITSGSTVLTHPIPLHEDVEMSFEGWFTDSECTRALDEDYIFTADITLYAKWSFTGHTHTFGEWEYFTDGSCEEPAAYRRECEACYQAEYLYDESVKGHTWGNWTEGVLSAERKCTVCEETQLVSYENITSNVISGAPILVGDFYNASNAGVLIDGIFNTSYSNTVVPRGTGDCSVVLNLKEATSLNRIYLKKGGTRLAYIYVVYEGESSYTYVDIIPATQDNSSHIPFIELDASKKVVSVELEIKNPSMGEDFLYEIALVSVPYAQLSENNRDTVVVTFNPTVGTFENIFDNAQYVEYGKLLNIYQHPLLTTKGPLRAGIRTVRTLFLRPFPTLTAKTRFFTQSGVASAPIVSMITENGKP